MSSETLPIGLLYTGGTIGMDLGPKGLTITSNAAEFEARLRSRLPADCPAFSRLDVEIPLMDSSNAQPADWLLLARLIYQHRERFAGFLVLTGTDTMAYTASALSFLLHGLDLPVVLTGAQKPLGNAQNVEEPGDAVSNVSGALEFCRALANRPSPNALVSCVFLAFDGLLFRGNCARKVDSRRFHAFDSPNLPPVACQTGDQLRLDEELLYRASGVEATGPSLAQRLQALDACANWNTATVASCFLLPGAAARQLETAVWSGCRALLLFSFGFGNVPSESKTLSNHLATLKQQGILMLNTTQCLSGGVGGGYEAGQALQGLGVRSAGLMTPEAAFTKLHLLANLPQLYPPTMLDTDLCGEQNVPV